MESNNESSVPAQHDHVVHDHDFHNVISLLNMLARQLELAAEESTGDHQLITQYCMSAGSILDDILNVPKKADTIKALQYYDRNCQRIDHVVKSLQTLTKNLTDESWRAIDLDLSVEVNKTNSFFSECQTKEMQQLVTGVCELDSSKDIIDNSAGTPPNDDLELF